MFTSYTNLFFSNIKLKAISKENWFKQFIKKICISMNFGVNLVKAKKTSALNKVNISTIKQYFPLN